MTYQELLNQIILLIPDNNSRQVTPKSVRDAISTVAQYVNERILGIPVIKAEFSDTVTIFDSRMVGKEIAFLFIHGENLVITDFEHSIDDDYLFIGSSNKRTAGDIAYIVFQNDLGGENTTVPYPVSFFFDTAGEPFVDDSGDYYIATNN